MKQFEMIMESMTPCGGSEHAVRGIWEVRAESPVADVEANKGCPIMDITEKENGDVVITTGNEVGYMTRYTFTE
ncbi:MAG: hypothetical protein MJ150_03085 [Clostridia bacterium]|nr:hypothetical protein [Clostridia bacterium]